MSVANILCFQGNLRRSSRFPQNIGTYIPIYMESYLRKQEYSPAVLWTLISHRLKNLCFCTLHTVWIQFTAHKFKVFMATYCIEDSLLVLWISEMKSNCDKTNKLLSLLPKYNTVIQINAIL